MTDHMQNKRVAITGAASGFGKLLTGMVLERGGKVLAMDIDAQGLDNLDGPAERLLRQPTDVTDLSAVRTAIHTAVDAWGGVDVMVNNAGVMPLAFYADHEQAYAAWERCIDINIKGVLNGIVAVYDQMLSQGRGHVVNLSSIYGNFPVVGAAVYGASKAAVDFLSESLRMEGQGKIKVTTIKPTGVPATNLGQGVINPEAVVGILGHKAPAYMQLMQAHQAGELPAEHTDPRHIEYYALEPQYLAEQILYAIDQPWGVAISEVTVRASGDAYIL